VTFLSPADKSTNFERYVLDLYQTSIGAGRSNLHGSTDPIGFAVAKAVPRMSDTAAQTSHSKSMTIGEGGTALALTALAFVALIVAAKAYTPEYAFHAYLFTAASAAAVIAIVNRDYERPAALAPLTIDGRPNYNTGPVKFATIRQCSGALRYVIVAQDAKRPARAQAQRKACAGDSAGAPTMQTPLAAT
jgi:hypothetical protein